MQIQSSILTSYCSFTSVTCSNLVCTCHDKEVKCLIILTCFPLFVHLVQNKFDISCIVHTYDIVAHNSFYHTQAKSDIDDTLLS